MPAQATDIIPRLWWDGHQGVARCDGVTVDLPRMPTITAIPVMGIDFAPTLRVCQIRESAQAWREMTAGERAAATALLKRISAAALAAVGGV